MKKSLFLVVFAMLSLGAIAQNSSISIFSETGDPFYVFLNSVRQNENPDTNVRVDLLTNPYYDAEIVFANPDIPSVRKKMLMAVDVDGNTGDLVYKIKRKGNGKLVLRFFSFAPYQQNVVVPDNVTVIQYNTVPMPAIVSTTTTQTTTTTNGGVGDNVSVGVNVGGVSVGMDVNINDTMSGSTTTTSTTTTTTTTGVIPNEVVVVEEDCYAMRPSDFRSALASIESKTFSDSKLTLAKQIVKRNCLTSDQIRAITTLFDFESTRLEFAKYAFPFCYNPENYWKVNDAFEFESSIEELDEYIGRQ